MADRKANWGKFGGSHAMHGKTGAGPQKPGVSSQEGHGSMNRGMLPDGSHGSGFYSSEGTNKDYAGTQAPGVSAATKSGGNGKFAEGGSYGTCPNRGSQPAVGGRNVPY